MRKASIWQYAIAIFLVFVFLVPVVYIISSSFKPINELFTANPTFFPKKFTFDNYSKAFARGDFLTYIFNSFYV